MKRIVNALGKLGRRKWAYTVLLLCATTAIALPAQTFTTLHSFDGTDGANPFAGLIQATDGNFYGTTYAGGAHDDGTVFKITPSGALTTLYSFCVQSGCPDGGRPSAGLVQATNGDFYGTTRSGGHKDDGTAFKITASGTLTTLYRFCSQTNCTDGQYPYGGLVRAANGDFYGTTAAGGANYTYCHDFSFPRKVGCGTVFEITPSGTLTTLYSFCSQSGCADGDLPLAGLVQATDGEFYGTTAGGGTHGDGTVFKITPSGASTTLSSFCSQSGCTDGRHPEAGLVQAASGDFYGTTRDGGTVGFGTVFRIAPSGTLTTLHSFCSQSGCTDGINPLAGLVQATDGNLYGTTSYGGGANYDGTVFKITPTGTLTTLYSFCPENTCPDGASPAAGLVQATNGDFYGTTVVGGAYSTTGAGDYGAIFRLSVGLGPFVETLPASGKAGAPVKILGTNLAVATLN